jgi:uncharacterized membrane protein
MESNINWELDQTDEDADDPDLKFVEAFVPSAEGKGMTYMRWNPFRNFINWFKRNKIASKIKKALCKIADKLKDLFDAEAKLKTILEVAVVALATALGITFINPLVLTLVVGILMMMMFKGFDYVCGL